MNPGVDFVVPGEPGKTREVVAHEVSVEDVESIANPDRLALRCIDEANRLGIDGRRVTTIVACIPFNGRQSVLLHHVPADNERGQGT